MNALDLLPDLRAAIEHLVDERVAAILADASATALARGYADVDSAAEYLGVTPGRVRKLVARREIPFFQEDAGCRVTFAFADLDAWMQSFRHETRRARSYGPDATPRQRQARQVVREA